MRTRQRLVLAGGGVAGAVGLVAGGAAGGAGASGAPTNAPINPMAGQQAQGILSPGVSAPNAPTPVERQFLGADGKTPLVLTSDVGGQPTVRDLSALPSAPTNRPALFKNPTTGLTNSPGDVGTSTVWPTDNRAAVGNSAQFPYDTNARIYYPLSNGLQYSCSASILRGPIDGSQHLVVITAGHCLYDQTNGKYLHDACDNCFNGPNNVSRGANAAYVYPGKNTSTKNPNPFGECREASSTVFTNYSVNGDQFWDMAVMNINCPNNTLDEMGTSRSNNNATTFNGAAVWAGMYNQTDKFNKDQQVFSPGTVFEGGGWMLTNNLSLVGGSSGSAVVWNSSNCSYCKIGVIEGESPTVNAFVPYNNDHFDPMYNAYN